MTPTPNPGTASTATAPERATWRRRLSPRARFRARLERDSRRWVLFIVAAEGLVVPMLRLSEKRDLLFGRGFGSAGLLVVMATLPVTAVALMFVQGRLLHWTGKLLKGGARRHEIHAAFAWSQAPFVAVGWPLVIEVPLRAAAADLDPVPGWLSWSIEAAVRIREPLEWIATIAAIAGVLLWVEYLAEAQRFSAWRAMANQLLAGAALIGLFAGGIELAAALVPTSNAIVYGAIASAAVLATVGGAGLIERGRRGARPAS